ncbi:MAG: ATP synthase subunit delta [Melioribacteraceae bacterium]|nr:MAG: ATP synthase subunit delta [Melioribacteraceae bacterium]
MSSYNVSTRYAKALTQLAEEGGNYNVIARDVEFVNNTYSGSRDLRVTLASPIVNESKKKDIIKAIFSGKIHTSTLEFLNFLLAKKRIADLHYILTRFLDMRDQKMGIVRISVKSAVELDKSQSDKLNESFKNITKKEVEMSFKTEDSLIGGFVAQYGDTLIDASVVNQLRLLKKKLLHEN